MRSNHATFRNEDDRMSFLFRVLEGRAQKTLETRYKSEERPFSCLAEMVQSLEVPKAVTTTDDTLWHARMGHPGPEAQNLLSDVTGVKIRPVATTDCEICATTKLRKDRSRIPLVSFDLFSFGAAFNGSQYLALFTDRFTGERRGYNIPHKTDLPTVWVKFVSFIKRRYDLNVVSILTDHEKALFTEAFKDGLAFEGVEILFSSPAHPHQNGHAERSGGVVTHTAARLMAQSGFPTTMWPTAVHHAIYLLNRLPGVKEGVKSQPIERRLRWLKNNNKDWSAFPEERLQQDLRHVRAYGCKAYPMSVTISSTEADFLALSHVFKELRAFERLCRQMGFEPLETPLTARHETYLKWVFVHKFNPEEYLAKHKARVVVCGNEQPPNELSVYACTLAARTFRLLMAIAAYFDLEARQYDFVNAFCNSNLDKEIYCKLPPGWQKKGKAWRLRKALHGLRRPPLLWYKLLREWLEKQGY
ncbi:hypothetical protein CP532_6651 [Ophiocordyceps camponoti-leonardi (nom. inval.)]|nr:hypothetical protein CP532_6651 [Ophiocordyceps camponoti-leonardi (nom. inval.)]